MTCWVIPELRALLGARAFGALAAAFLAAALLAVPMIARMRRKKIGERTEKTPIEDEKLRTQITAKAGTPTMGGVIIAAGLFVGCLLWGDLSDLYLWLAVVCFVSLAALGMADDWLKLSSGEHRARGLKVRHKLLIQAAIGGALGAVWFARAGGRICVPYVPMARLWLPSLGAVLIVWVALVVATMSNAANVADGLDGLAAGLGIVALVPLCFAASRPWHELGQPDVAELCVFCAALGGALLGFLWHNWHPARVFMGDTGSLALGGSIALVAVMARVELMLPLIAFVFLVEFGSSVLQVLWFRATGRRILPIAPIHHMFQRKGWPETHIVARFLIVGALVAFGSLLFL